MTAIFNVQCLGRKADGVAALEIPVNVAVKVRQRGNSVGVSVECIHNTGGHGQRCKAYHPEVDKVGDGVICPYSIDIPWHRDQTIVGP